MKGKLKGNCKLIVGIIIGVIIATIGVKAATTTKDILYDNTNSNLTSTDMQGAIDELNTKATTKIAEAEKKCPNGYNCTKTIEAAYTYNSSNCITGEETTCVKTSCYENKTLGSCPIGTIIKYRVNNTTVKYFHVLHDDGNTMTLQQRENTVSQTWWNNSGVITDGPQAALQELESATSDWTNVENQTYEMGTTSLSGKGAYTGCNTNLSCTTNTYTLGSRTARARMITVQEAKSLGCTKSSGSCPAFMHNYLAGATSYGGTVDASSGVYGYWTMSANSSSSYSIWSIIYSGCLDSNITVPNSGPRAVVVINK